MAICNFKDVSIARMIEQFGIDGGRVVPRVVSSNGLNSSREGMPWILITWRLGVVIWYQVPIECMEDTYAST